MGAVLAADQSALSQTDGRTTPGVWDDSGGSLEYVLVMPSGYGKTSLSHQFEGTGAGVFDVDDVVPKDAKRRALMRAALRSGSFVAHNAYAFGGVLGAIVQQGVRVLLIHCSPAEAGLVAYGRQQ